MFVNKNIVRIMMPSDDLKQLYNKKASSDSIKKLVTLDKDLFEAVDFTELGINIDNCDQSDISFKNGEKYVIDNESCDGSVVDDTVYEVYGVVNSYADEELNSVIMRAINPKPTSRRYSISKSDCTYLGIEYADGLELLPKSMKWKRASTICDFDKDDLSTTPRSIKNDTITSVLLVIHGFQTYPRSLVLTPNGRLIHESALINDLRIINNFPLVVDGVKRCDIDTLVDYEIIRVSTEKYNRSAILSDSNVMYVMLHFDFDGLGLDPSSLYQVSPKVMFTLQWDELGALTLKEYEDKEAAKKREEERLIAEREAQIREARRKEEEVKEQLRLKRIADEKRRKEETDSIINSLCEINLAMPDISVDTDFLSSINSVSESFIDGVDKYLDDINNNFSDMINTINQLSDFASVKSISNDNLMSALGNRRVF